MDNGGVVKKFNFEKGFAQLISFVFNPLFMPLYCFTIIFYTPNYISNFLNVHSKNIILLITFIFTVLLPFLNILLLKTAGKISSIKLENREERTLPFIGVAVFYSMLLYLFYKTSFPNILKLCIIGAAINIFIAVVITSKWKISAHSIGIGGLTGCIFALILKLQLNLHDYVVPLIFIAGLVGYARLKLSVHTPAQVYSGLLLGFLTQFIIMLV